MNAAKPNVTWGVLSHVTYEAYDTDPAGLTLVLKAGVIKNARENGIDPFEDTADVQFMDSRVDLLFRAEGDESEVVARATVRGVER